MQKLAGQMLPFLNLSSEIDFVLAADNEDDNEEHKEVREIYIKNLIRRGLDVQSPVLSHDGKTLFWRISAPIEVLYTLAEELNVHLPTEVNDVGDWNENKVLRWLKSWWDGIDQFIVKDSLFEAKPRYFASRFEKRILTQFIHHDEPDKLFTRPLRSRLVSYVLDNTQFTITHNFRLYPDIDVGIAHLKAMGIFTDAYPCHDEPLDDDFEYTPGPSMVNDGLNDRQKLCIEWANFGHIFKYQPIEAIKDYLGEKTAFYFAWIGVYTTCLVPATIVGIICVIYGGISIIGDDVLQEICYPAEDANHIMCPLCDKYCTYYVLKDGSCSYSLITHIFDNNITPFFAVFMSFWSVVYLEIWKRQECKLLYDWHIAEYVDDEAIRPQYSMISTETTVNPVTGKLEPKFSKSSYALRISSTFTVVIFFVCLVIASVVGVIVYSAVMYSAKYIHNIKYGSNNFSKLFIAITGATLNLIFINILKLGYEKLAYRLTEWENPRTQSSFEDSFILKVFWFEFCNTYASLFYVAFFKNEFFTGWPGHYIRLANRYRLEGCSDQGCFLELCIQIIIIMGGQQFLGNIAEFGWPWIKKKYNLWRHRLHEVLPTPRWETDYQLSQQPLLSLVWEYREIVIQYGFVTLFVSAFPIAPFIALCTNLVEIRIDAINTLTSYRRPVAHVSKGIEIWYEILATVTALSVLVNGFVLAFASEFIPRQVYKYQFSVDGTMKGYVNWTLSLYNVSHFSDYEKPNNMQGFENITTCRFRGHHDMSDNYDFDMTHWKILAFRLLFVFLFHWTVTASTSILAWIIPDRPKSVDLSMKRKNYLIRKSIQANNIKLRSYMDIPATGHDNDIPSATSADDSTRKISSADDSTRKISIVGQEKMKNTVSVAISDDPISLNVSPTQVEIM